MTEVTEGQFSWEGDRLVHEPTGTTFELNSEFINYAQAGDTLDSGECYERAEVAGVANNMVFVERARRAAESS